MVYKDITKMLFILLLAGSSCMEKEDGKLTIGISFEILQTEYWVASIEAIKA